MVVPAASSKGPAPFYAGRVRPARQRELCARARGLALLHSDRYTIGGERGTDASMSEPATAEPPAPAGPALGQLTRDLFGLDLRSLALLRVLLAVLLLWDLGERLFDLRVFYTDDGVWPPELFARKLVPPGPISIHFVSGSLLWQGLLVAVAMAVALLLLVGWHTRLMTFLSWFLLISAHARNVAILHGGDNLLRVLLFWAIFLPLGGRYSLDAAAKLGPVSDRARARSLTVLSPASFAFLFQLCMLYWFAAALKIGAEWHGEASAIWYALNVDEFTTRFGRFLLQFPALLPLLTRFTMLLEWYGPFLLFVPFYPSAIRLVLIPVFVLFHLGLGLTLELGNFPAVCCAGWLALLPGVFWDRLAAWCRTPLRTGMVVHHRAGDRLRHLLGFLFLSEVRTMADQADGWRLVDHRGKEHAGPEAFPFLVWASPIWWPLGSLLWLGPLRGLSEALYRRFSASARVGAGSGDPAPTREDPAPTRGPEPRPAPVVVHVIVVFLIAYVFVWNLRTVDAARYQRYLPAQTDGLAVALGLEQMWGLFAPTPPHFGGWYVVEGRLRDGRSVDLWNGGRPLSFDKPELVSATYRDPRWRKYLMNLRQPQNAVFRDYLAQYLARQWDRSHPPAEQVEAPAVVWYLYQETLPHGKAPEVKREQLWPLPRTEPRPRT
jgi:hypothetical protein